VEGKGKNTGHLAFPGPETMRIPVQETIVDPVLFRIDLGEHRIYRSQRRRGSYQTTAVV
jgi:hypothetical protein